MTHKRVSHLKAQAGLVKRGNQGCTGIRSGLPHKGQPCFSAHGFPFAFCTASQMKWEPANGLFPCGLAVGFPPKPPSSCVCRKLGGKHPKCGQIRPNIELLEEAKRPRDPEKSGSTIPSKRGLPCRAAQDAASFRAERVSLRRDNSTSWPPDQQPRKPTADARDAGNEI